ncbi:hypothetical protein [Burkholderia cenocepacia]|uniref:hypothetical protein n=1 Tax=Burkholderia cenocepacia TaxID=95486 RepID=UPI0007621308|nr:hypothetical protein [Burkholderia cenocepacia]KWU26320.1 hypothetical protein AS149_25350 [Burkholderia cenocepacia]
MDAVKPQYARNGAALVAIEAVLSQRDVAHARKGDAIRAELRVGDTTYAIAYFMDAEYLFTVDERPDERYDPSDRDYLLRPVNERTPERTRRRFENLFETLQMNLMSDDFYAQPRKDICLVAVGTAEYLYGELDFGRRSFVEQDNALARKRVLTLQQVDQLLDCPFPRVERAPEALPLVELCPEMKDLPDSAREVTDTFGWKEMEALLANTDVLAAENAELRNRIEAILLRVMEGGYRIFWYEDEVAIGRAGDKRGTPIVIASAGEQKAYALAYFLAKLSVTATPATRVEFQGALSGFSLLWLFGLLDVLREFVIATGASLRLQAPQSDRRGLAKRKFDPIASVKEYGYRFR